MTQEHKMYPGLDEHGWRFSNGSGDFGPYGWGFGIQYSKNNLHPHIREPRFRIHFGPWIWEWSKLIRLVD